MRFSTTNVLFALSALAALSMTGCVDLTPCSRGTEGCVCAGVDGDECDPVPGAKSICGAGVCVAQRTYADETVCYDACAYRGDGVCDDGGDGSSHDDCGFGSDCSDCGARENPCAGGAMPIFCPQTPTACWPTGIDCLAVRFCGMTGPFGCPTGQAIDCNAVGGPKCVATTVCQNQGLTPCVVEAACVAPQIDCNSLVTCNAMTVGCFTGEKVVCTPGQPPACQ